MTEALLSMTIPEAYKVLLELRATLERTANDEWTKEPVRDLARVRLEALDTILCYKKAEQQNATV